MALPGLVDGVGHDLKNGVLAALQPIGAKDNTGAFTHPVGPLQGGNGLVAVTVIFLGHSILFLTFQSPPVVPASGISFL